MQEIPRKGLNSLLWRSEAELNWNAKVDAGELKRVLLRVAREKHAEWCPVREDLAADCKCGIDNDD